MAEQAEACPEPSLPLEAEARQAAIAVRDYILGNASVNLVIEDQVDFEPVYAGMRLAMRDRVYLLDGCAERLNTIAYRMNHVLQAEAKQNPQSLLKKNELFAQISLAACRGADPARFFLERGQSTRAAREVCKLCVIQESCLEYAVEGAERFGIWGGTSERQRRRIRRLRGLAAQQMVALVPGQIETTSNN